MKVVEGVEGVWFYHLSESGLSGQPALCGEKHVMSTSIPLTYWGTKGHLHERYCLGCGILYYSSYVGFRCTKGHNEASEPKPFKSGYKVNTIKGVIDHPKLHIPAYTFEEDESYVECRRCVIL